MLLLIQIRMLLVLLAGRAHCWLMFNLLSAKIPRFLLAALLPSLSLPSLHQCNGLLSPKYSTSYLFLQNCMKFLPAYSSGSLMPIWMEILFSKVQVVLPTLMQLSFTSAANLMSMHQLHHLSDD